LKLIGQFFKAQGLLLL